MKPVYFATGWIFFFLGIIGVILPVLPTTPFMLLALWAFSKSSDRFHYWLYNHKYFGPLLQQWQQYHVIPLTAKVFAISMMVISFVYLLLYRQLHVSILIAIALVMLYGMRFILTKPSSVRDSEMNHLDKKRT